MYSCILDDVLIVRDGPSLTQLHVHQMISTVRRHEDSLSTVRVRNYANRHASFVDFS